MEEPVLKTSKCLSCDIVKGSQPFKSGDELPGEPLRGRLYEALFATGDKAYIKGTDDRPPLYVGEPGKEWFYAFRLVPKKRADNSYILTIEVDRSFEPGEKMPLKKSKLADGSAAAAIAAQVPGVKLASELPAGKIAPAEPIAEPATAPKVTNAPEEKVAPALRPATKSFADTAKDTVKVGPEQLKAEAAKPTTPDEQVRTSTVKRVQFVETWKGGQRHTYAVDMDNGDSGFMYPTDKKDPTTVGAELTYHLKATKTGKTIEVQGAKESLDRDLMIIRQSCSRDAVAIMAMRGVSKDATLEALMETHAHITRQLEAHVLRPIE